MSNFTHFWGTWGTWGLKPLTEQLFAHLFTGQTITNLNGTRSLVNEGTETQTLLLKTGDGVDASVGITVTFSVATYVTAFRAIDLITGKQITKVVDASVTSYEFKHYNPVNGLVAI